MKKLLLLTGLALSSFAYEAQEIVTKALDAAYYQGNALKSKAHMKITDLKGRERIRETLILRSNLEEGKQKYYVYFKKPSEMKKMVFIAWKEPNKADDRWLYLPALDLVKRIAASDDRTSFVGSHFFYEDVSGRGDKEDEHTLLKETDTQYHLQSYPKDKDSVEFKYFQTYVDKATFLPMKIIYFNAKDRAYRSYEVLETKTIDGFSTITKAIMKDNQTGSTEISYSDIEYLQSLPEKIFTERYLRKTPKKYLR